MSTVIFDVFTGAPLPDPASAPPRFTQGLPPAPYEPTKAEKADAEARRNPPPPDPIAGWEDEATRAAAARMARGKERVNRRG
jgi:hypothetical protein